MRILLTLICLSSLFYCKVDDLKTRVLAKISLKGDVLSFPDQNGIYHEIPARVGIYADTLIISEPSERSIKIFEEGKLEKAIRSRSFYTNPGPEKISVLNAVSKNIFSSELNIPGMATTASDGSFYILNYSPEKHKNLVGRNGEYTILHFNPNGKLKGRIIQENIEALKDVASHESMSSSSQKILWMDVDEDDHLWLLYEDKEQNNLVKYKNTKPVYRLTQDQCLKDILKDIEKQDDQLYSCEAMYPFYDGENVLLVGRMDKVSKDEDGEKEYIFEYRRFKTKGIESNEVKEIFVHHSSPYESPGTPYGNQSFIIWEVKDYHLFRLKIYDLSGSLEKELEIKLKGYAHSWRNTYTTLKSNIYSLKVADESLLIYQWR